MSTLYKFTVIEWTYNEDTTNFTVIFAVSSSSMETFKFIVVTAPYSFEDPEEFIAYVKIQAHLQFKQYIRIRDIQQALSNLTFNALAEQNTITE